MDQMERELIAEKKFREAAEELVNAKTDMLDMRTRICKDGVKYFIRIWKEDFEDTLRRK